MEPTSGLNEPRPESAETVSIKDGMETPPPTGSNRSASPISCAICLGTCVNTSFTESCLHRFCFTCLVTWSKVKAECPLCKQMFRSIIHNVQSDDQYDVYNVNELPTNLLDDYLPVEPRFRFRTTLTLGRRESLAIQQLLSVAPLPNINDFNRRRGQINNFRRSIYHLNLWSHPLPDFTGRFRECSPEFYRNNPAQLHRTVPWLTRELSVLLENQPQHINYVLSRILELLPEHSIQSDEFRQHLVNYFRENTNHFIHELYNFASSPYDLTGYDRYVQFSNGPPYASIVNEVISSSEDDSDVQIVSTVRQPRQPNGEDNSRQSVGLGSEIVIETIDHSDSDDSNSEVVMVGYVKPPQDRTPEVVDLLLSDSDVVLEEVTPRPSTSGYNAPVEMPLNSNLVKLSLTKRQTKNNDTKKMKKRKRKRSSSDESWNVSASTDTASDWSLNCESDSTQNYVKGMNRREQKRRLLNYSESDDSSIRKQKKRKKKKTRKDRSMKKPNSKSTSKKKHKKHKKQKVREIIKENSTSTNSCSESEESTLNEKNRNYKKCRKRTSITSNLNFEEDYDWDQPGPSCGQKKFRRIIHSDSSCSETYEQNKSENEINRIKSVVNVMRCENNDSETERYTPPNTPPSNNFTEESQNTAPDTTCEKSLPATTESSYATDSH